MRFWGGGHVDDRAQIIREFAASSAASRINVADPEVQANIERAKQQHRKRFWTQVMFWGAALLTSFGISPVMRYVVGNDSRACTTAPLTAICYQSSEYLILGAFAGVSFLVWLYHHFWYLRERKHEWETAISNAQAMISAEKTAEGNTDLFRIYVQTKRRSYWLITLAFACAIAAAAYALAIVQSMQSLIDATNPLGAPLVLVTVLSSIGLLRAAYLIGSSFAPGEVIVRHIIALAFLAVSNITDISEVRRQVEDRTKEFVKRSPWWFYTTT